MPGSVGKAAWPSNRSHRKAWLRADLKQPPGLWAKYMGLGKSGRRPGIHAVNVMTALVKGLSEK